MVKVPPAIVMRGISKRFGPVQALSEVDLTVGQGEGSRACRRKRRGQIDADENSRGSASSPTAEQLKSAGERCEFEGPQEAIEAGISMIYQDLDLAEHLTVAENVFLGHEPREGLPFTVDP